jgi:hypothetical protein
MGGQGVDDKCVFCVKFQIYKTFCWLICFNIYFFIKLIFLCAELFLILMYKTVLTFYKQPMAFYKNSIRHFCSWKTKENDQ